jgi:hypothetical protein
MASPWKDIGRYGSVGIEFVLTILILSWCGHWLDGRFWGGRGWGLVVGFLLGVAVGFRNLVRTAQQMQRDIERAEARDPQAGRWTVDPHWLHEEPQAASGESEAEDDPERGASGAPDGPSRGKAGPPGPGGDGNQ